MPVTGKNLGSYEALLAPHSVFVIWPKKAMYFKATRVEYVWKQPQFPRDRAMVLLLKDPFR